MANITNFLTKIKTAVHGKDVRGAIHDAIKQVYDDASVDHDNANMEVKLARGTHNTLNDRLDNVDEIQAQTNAQLSAKIQEVASTGTTSEVIQSKVQQMSEEGLIQAYTIGDNTITAEKMDFIRAESINLFDMSKVEDGFYHGNIGYQIEKAENSNFKTIRIRCKKNTTYACTGTSYSLFLTDKKGKITSKLGNPSSDVSNFTFTTDNECYYMYISYKFAIFPTSTYVVVEGDKMINYQKYNPILKFNYDFELENNSVTPEKMTFCKLNKINLFNKNAVKTGFYHGEVGSSVSIESNSNEFYCYSFDCEESCEHTVSGSSYWIIFTDKTDTVISRTANPSQDLKNYTFTTPEGASKCYISFKTTIFNKDQVMLVKGNSIPSTYVPYEGVLEFDYQLSSEEKKEQVTTCYVSPTGSDSNDGTTRDKPFATFQKAIDEGATLIIGEPGTYRNQWINKRGTGVEKIEITVPTDATGNPRSCIYIDNSYHIENLYLSGGVYSVAMGKLNDNWNKVFITKELEPIKGRNPSWYPMWNVNVWEINEDGSIANDVRLEPKLSLDECKKTASSFYWDGSNIYINPTNGSIDGKKYRALTKEYDNTISFVEMKEVKIKNINTDFSWESGIATYNCNEVHIESCVARYNGYECLFRSLTSNSYYKNCIALKAAADGFDGNGCGYNEYISCEAGYCYDDGISHHDGNEGVIIGGIFHHCQKSGVAPAHGARMELINVIAHDNQNGFYCHSDSGRVQGRELRLTGCIAYNNNKYGITVANYHVKTLNCKFENNLLGESNVAASNENTSLLKI